MGLARDADVNEPEVIDPEEAARIKAEEDAYNNLVTEQNKKAAIYARALRTLKIENPKRFDSNYRTFTNWDLPHQIWWIENIEKQAANGAKTIGVEVVVAAVKIRLAE